MALVDLGAIDVIGSGTGFDLTTLGAESHGTPQVRGLRAALNCTIGTNPLGDQCNHGLGGAGVELGGVGLGQTSHMSGVFDDGQLHAQADAQVRDFVLTGEGDGLDLALDTALAKAANRKGWQYGNFNDYYYAK